jgi:hypothetical protein
MLYCRWARVQGASNNGEHPAWVGGLLQGVVVDDWGEFNFILVRVRGLGGRQRMLVRGGNYASRAQLVEALTRQVRPWGRRRVEGGEEGGAGGYQGGTCMHMQEVWGQGAQGRHAWVNEQQ